MTGSKSRTSRVLALLSGGFLWVSSAGGAVANQSVFNDSGSAVIMEGELANEHGHEGELAPANGGPATGGFVQAWQGQGDPAQLSVSIVSFVEITCEGDPTDPEDDYLATLATAIFADGEASMDIDRRYASGTASTTTEVFRFMVNECTGDFEESIEPGVTLTLTMVGESDLIRERGTGSFQIPGEFNSHAIQRSVYRWASGTLTIGSEVMEVAFGRIGQISWNSHDNS